MSSLMEPADDNLEAARQRQPCNDKGVSIPFFGESSLVLISITTHWTIATATCVSALALKRMKNTTEQENISFLIPNMQPGFALEGKSRNVQLEGCVIFQNVQ